MHRSSLFASAFVVACSNTPVNVDASSADATSDVDLDVTTETKPDSACMVDASCGNDCFPHDAPFWACGTLYYTPACDCRPIPNSSWPDCSKPGPVGEGEFCGTYWWCNRTCAQGLVCAPIPKQPDAGPGSQGDYRTTCQKPPSDAGPG